MLALGLLLASSGLSAELIFGATVGSPSNPGFRVFRATGGTVTQVQVALPQPLFPSVSPGGNLLVVSSPDPAQPGEASQDLFAVNLQNGQVRKLWNNVTQALPGGGFLFATPQWSGTSSNGQRVAFVNQTSATSDDPASGGTRQLRVIRASDGFDLALAEIGNGSALDLFQSEFVGISWLPGSDFFATPAYVPIVNNLGQSLFAAGIVLFGPVGPPGQPYARAQVLTLPTAVANPPFGNIISTHAYPAFSPNGQVVASFNPGFFPAGLSWRNPGSLVFSLGSQTQAGGLFLPTIQPETAQILTIPATGGAIGQVPGVGHGFFPNGLPPSPIIFQSRFQ